MNLPQCRIAMARSIASSLNGRFMAAFDGITPGIGDFLTMFTTG